MQNWVSIKFDKNGYLKLDSSFLVKTSKEIKICYFKSEGIAYIQFCYLNLWHECLKINRSCLWSYLKKCVLKREKG